MIGIRRSRLVAALTAAVIANAGCSTGSPERSASPAPTSTPAPAPTATKTPSADADELVDSQYCQEVRRFLEEGHQVEDLLGPEGRERASELYESLDRIAQASPESMRDYWEAAANLAASVRDNRAPAFEDAGTAIERAGEVGRQTGELCDLPEPTVTFSNHAQDAGGGISLTL